MSAELRPAAVIWNRDKELLWNSPLIDAAYTVAERVHSGDRRKSGEPYLSHLVAVANIIEQEGGKEPEVAAGLLHDAVEDHPDLISFAEIAEMFGTDVASLVEGATKISLGDMLKEDLQFETLRRIVRRSGLDLRLLRLKGGDRLHNLGTLDSMPLASRLRTAREALEVYAPIFEGYGWWQFKCLFQDLAFPVVYPEAYANIRREVDKDPRLDMGFIEARKVSLEMNFGKGVEVRVNVAGYYEVWEKMRRLMVERPGEVSSVADIDDLISFRVVGLDNDERKIFMRVGKLLESFGDKVRYDLINDFVSKPAPNGYRAFHLPIESERGLIEIALVTEHDEKLNSRGAFAEEGAMKELNLCPVMVFSRDRKLVVLPKGATALDFAYKLRPDLGLQMEAAMVNGVRVPFDHQLQSGDQIEVVEGYSHRTHPRREYANKVLTTTRRLMEYQDKVAVHRESVVRGKEKAEMIIREFGLLDLSDLDESYRVATIDALSCGTLEQVYLRIANDDRYLERLRRIMDKLEIKKRGFCSLALEGEDELGLAAKVRSIILKFGGNVLRATERVNRQGKFRLRYLLVGVLPEKRFEMLEEIRTLGKVIERQVLA